MPKEVPEVSIALEAGAPPAALSAGSVLGERRASVLSACLIGATSRRTLSSRRERRRTAAMLKIGHPTST